MLDASMKQLGAPSAMVIAMQNGKLLFESYRGTARLNQSVPVTADSGFMIASNSKVFTSVMLYQLRDRGALPQGLDTTVASLMPGWVEPAAPGSSRRPLTLRALATHASGLPRETPTGSNLTEQEILDKIGAARMLFPQFASTAYSNLGVALLGRTLERATPGGLSWEAWMEQEIMKPLGMSHSGPCVRTAADAASIVDGLDGGELVRRPFTNSSRCPWWAPCGDIFSTPGDMSKWASFMLGATEAPGVLDPSSVLELRNSAMLQADGISAVSGATLEAALSHGRWTFNKLGCLEGYRSATTVVPQLGLSLFAAAASTCDFYGDGDAVGFPIVSKLIPALDDVLAARLAEAFELPHDGPAAADYVGRYCDGGAARVSLEGGALLMRGFPGGYPWALLPMVGSGEADAFRMMMREPPPTTPGCSSAQWPGAQLCHTSCFREMARGDVQPLYFERNATGHVFKLRVPGSFIECGRVG